jgi:DNA invertase Pin-like site-specific DNA recombinase
MIKDRSKGFERARAKGKTIGGHRVDVDVDPHQVTGLRARGRTWNEIPKELGIRRGTAQRAFYSLPKTLLVESSEGHRIH